MRKLELKKKVKTRKTTLFLLLFIILNTTFYIIPPSGENNAPYHTITRIITYATLQFMGFIIIRLGYKNNSPLTKTS